MRAISRSVSRSRLAWCRFSIERLEPRHLLTRLVDLDSDGDLDALRGDTWYENLDGQGNFTSHMVTLRNVSTSLAADVDGDGDLDVLTNEPRWYENAGDGRFVTEHVMSNNDSLFDEIRVFDVGADGDIDLIGLKGDQAHLLENVNGEGSFSETIHRLTDNARDVGDFDLDGRLDVLLLEGNLLSVRFDRGNGVFDEQPVVADRTEHMWNGQLADVNGDGRLDVIRRVLFAGGNHAPVYWHENDQGVVDQRGVLVGEEGHGNLWFEDFDWDGDLDVIYNDRMNEALILRENTNGQFIRQASFPARQVAPLQVGDLNGDDRPDAILRFEDRLPIWMDGATGKTHINQLPPVLQSPSAAFVERNLSAVGPSPVLLHDFADLNGDGQADAIVSPAPDGPVSWFIDRDQDGVFTESGGPFADFADYSEIFGRLGFTDFDSDGDVDIVAFKPKRFAEGRPFWGYSVLVLNNTDGAGTFDSVRTGIEVTDGLIQQFAIADVDRDGDQDIVTVDETRGTELRVHLQTKEGFQSESVYSSQSRWMELLLTDIDLDGDADIVTSDSLSVVWHENQNGQFTGRGTLVNGRGSIATASADPSGGPDLIVADDAAISLYWNEDGNYRKTGQIPFEANGTIGTGDMDGDGDLDIFVHSTKSVQWFERRDGRFLGPFVIDEFSAATGFLRPVNTHFLDWDGDGDMDVALKEGSRWRLYESRRAGDVNGDGLFNSADLVQVFQVGKYEDGVDHNATFSEGDWNQDGDFDSADLVFAFELGHYSAAAQPAYSELWAAIDAIFSRHDDRWFFLR